MLTLLADADLYAPEHLGVQHLLLAGDRVEWIGADRPSLDPALVEVWELEGRTVVPGLVDGHVHITGGGGEAGPASSVPPLPVEALTRHGVTTAVGLLGTDDVVRTPASVLRRVAALRREGLRAWMLTGGYHLPAATVTGGVTSDVLHLDAVLGVGEVAVGDHRGSHPTAHQLLELAARVRTGALLAGKAGSIHLHLGDQRSGTDLLDELLARRAVPVAHWHPTHANRSSDVLDASIDLADRHGVRIDLTAFPVTDPGPAAAAALVVALDRGVSLDLLTCSSDAGGSLPWFDEAGRTGGLAVGDASGLLRTVRALVADGWDLAAALRPVTATPAAQLGLGDVGRLEAGARADLLVLDGDLQPLHVVVGGRAHVRDGEQLVRSTITTEADA